LPGINFKPGSNTDPGFTMLGSDLL
jgi:hypothetical protein